MHGRRRRRSSCSPMKYVDSTGAPLSQNKEELRQDRKSNRRDAVGDFFKSYVPTGVGGAVAGAAAGAGLAAMGSSAAPVIIAGGVGGGLAQTVQIGGEVRKAIRRAKNRKIFEKGYTETDIDAFEL